MDTTDKEWVMEDLLRDDTTQSIGDSQKMSQSVVGNPFLTSRTEKKKLLVPDLFLVREN